MTAQTALNSGDKMLTEKEMDQAIDDFLKENTCEALAEGWQCLERFGRAIEEILKKKHGIEIPVEAACLEAKPPLGVMPEKLWKECRVWDLMECLVRYRNKHTPTCELWLDELRRLLHDILYK